MRAVFFQALFFSVSVVCSAAEPVCPWLSSATAQGILNGAVTTIFTPSTKREEDGVCEFESKRGAMIDSLRIEVITIADIPKEFAAFLAHCSRNAPHLRGIGNDAVVCASQATRAEVVSRVREHALLVRASSNSKTTGSQRLQEQARTAAEQTAGNLF